MPYTTVVAAATITASWGNANVRDQVVTPFTDASARASAITSPVAGMISTLTTTNRVDTYNGTVWCALVDPSDGPLISWTPTFTQPGAITKTVNHATYSRAGRMVNAQFDITATGTGTTANNILMGLPVAAANTRSIGIASFFDASGPIWVVGAAFINTSTTFGIIANGTTGFLASPAIAVGDIVSASLLYEAAADA